MGFFDFLKTKPQKTSGKIGYFGLEDWWLNDLTAEERNYIKQTFTPMGHDEDYLTGKDIRSTTQTAISFLVVLSGWFLKAESRYIARKIIKKAEDLIDSGTTISDCCALYGSKIELLHKDRHSETNGIEKVIEACNQHISFSQQAASSFLNEHKNWPLPTHVGFSRLAIILEDNKNYQEALNISNEALKQGWAGDWEKRIERCKKKLSKINK